MATAPTWRDSSAACVLSGLYLVLVATASYGFGAYIAARLRVPSANTSDISEFRNGVDGLLVWALATLLTGLVALAIAQAAPRSATPSGSSEQTSFVGENIIAYDLDRLFRSERRPQGLVENMNYPRAEAARILLIASSHRGMQAEDRNYLVRLVGNGNWISAARCGASGRSGHCASRGECFARPPNRRHFRFHGRCSCVARRCRGLVCGQRNWSVSGQPPSTTSVLGLGRFGAARCPLVALSGHAQCTANVRCWG